MTSKAPNTGNFTRVYGNGLFLREKPHNGDNTKRGGALRTQIGNAKLPEISSRKIRERLIHLLALKSFAKAEIFSILQQQGIRHCEIKVIITVLKDVAQLHHNSYSLRRHIWREVDENWPYYTEAEQKRLKWLKEQRLRASNSGDEVTSTSSYSPASTASSSPPQKHGHDQINVIGTLKRPNMDVDEPQLSKKIRNDHTVTNSQRVTNISAESNNFDFSNYTEITNQEQRRQYKTAFDRYYEEYLPLFRYIEELDYNFGELGGQILAVSVEHPDYDRIKKCIVDTHYRINSQEEIKKRQRCDYLHAKLTHIKELVTRYDNKCTEEIAVAAAVAKAKEQQQRRQQQQSTPKPDEITITKGDAASAAPTENSTKKCEYPEFLGTDLALSESDSDED